jgi:hypothetical protein
MKSIDNEGEVKFNAFLEQIEKCVSQKLFFVAIMACLAIPDIGGAIDSDDGKAVQKSYEGWFNKYASPKYRGIGENRLTGKECYFLRCSMLHQGKSHHKALKKYSDIIFSEIPQTNSPVNPVFLSEINILLVEPKTFCNNIIYAAYDWLEVVHNNELFKKNTDKFMTLFSLSFSFPELPK